MFKNIYHITYKLISKIILILHPNKYNLTDQLFVDSKLRQYESSLKNLLKWSYNPISILTFLNFLILNFILYWVYLFFLSYFVTYWFFWFTYYRFSSNITELKPSEDLYSWEISVSYSFIHICYLQTFYKGYLNSFNLLYLICYFCKKNNTYDYGSVMKFIPRFICTLGWVLFRVFTSLPRNVVMDSYKWSLDFTHSYKYWHYHRKNLTKNIKFIIIKCLIQDTLYGSLFPQSYLRVYKSSVELWNFNPVIRGETLTMSLNKALSSTKILNTLKLFDVGSVHYKQITNNLTVHPKLTTPTSSVPHTTVVGEIANNPNSTQGYKPYYMMMNQTRIHHPNCIVGAEYKNSSPNQFYSRLSFGDSFKAKSLISSIDNKLMIPELDLTIRDARVIWVKSDVFKIDYYLALVKYNESISKITTKLKRDGFLIDPYFDKVLYELDSSGSIDEFNLLTETEQQYLALAILYENYPKTIDILHSYNYLYLISDSIVDL